MVTGATAAGITFLGDADASFTKAIGLTFTAPPVSIPAGHFGTGHGGGAHAPNEYYLIDSTNPTVGGLVDATMGFVEFLYTLAAIK